MKKKMLSLLLVGAMATGLLTGCGSSSSAGENGEINIFIWTEYVSESAISA